MKNKDYVLRAKSHIVRNWLHVNFPRTWYLELNQDDDVGDAETEHFRWHHVRVMRYHKIEEP